MRMSVRLPLAVVTTGVIAAGVVAPASAVTQDPKAGALKAAVTHAMDTEAFAYAQYNAFADNAGRDRAAADTWRAVADIEYWDHFVTEGKTVGLTGTNTENLTKAAAAEAAAVKSYAAAAKIARAEGCTKVAEAFVEIGKDEAAHQAAFVEARRNLWRGKAVPAAPAIQAVKIVEAKATCNRPGTMKALMAAMESESLSWASYEQWAEKAANSGQPRLASLFRGIGLVELKDHFAMEANLFGLVGPVKRNLQVSAASEVDANAMYTTDIRRAQSLKNRNLAALLTEIRSDERGHLASFRSLLAR